MVNICFFECCTFIETPCTFSREYGVFLWVRQSNKPLPVKAYHNEKNGFWIVLFFTPLSRGFDKF